ncbi:RHS repeat-associated core domain-containing protein [Actinomadura scrupuli]|uniref:RHS repeat-associated core domain-containing protein n=1 Tax=Actinomadura scrupuli TaxID=559629 RepID=UPI003D955BF6
MIAIVILGPLVVVGNWAMGGPSRPHAPAGLAVKGAHKVPFRKPRKLRDDAATTAQQSKVSWPSAGTGVATLDARKVLGSKNPAAGRVAAGKTPVWAQPIISSTGTYQGPGKVAVRVADRKTAEAAGVTGLVFTATAQHPASQPATATRGGAGPVRIGVDYAAMVTAYGGNWSAALRLVQLPACALTTPNLPACRQQTALAGAGNYLRGHNVYAQPAALATGTPMVLAATSGGTSDGSPGGGDGGAAGTYNASDLKPSGSWTGGGSKGSFTYSYPITVPPAASGLVPTAGLSYDSASVDGQTSATEAQANWLGDGWSTPQSYIEQSFTSCAASPEGTAAPKKTADNCYAGPILTLSLNGSTTALVWDSASSTFKPASANGDRIEHVINSGNGSGTYNNDYWKVTDRTGTVYSFGLNHLPGWGATGSVATNSVDSEPVYSAHAPNGTTFTDPCYKASGFADSWCTMAYRWNLDYVTDLHHNAMAYYYKQDTADYTRNPDLTADPATFKANTTYVRDSHLEHIDYGFTDGQAYTSNCGATGGGACATGKVSHVPNQVLFNTGPRCLTGTCTFPTPTARGGWYDVPNTLICTMGQKCLTTGPAHWSSVRLTGIATQQWTGAAYAPVDSWAFTQTMPDPGDGTDPTLWLSWIVHTGADTTAGGSAVTLPRTSFASQKLPNRVDATTDGLGPLNRMRVQSVTTETGSVIGVNYIQANPCPTPSTIDPAHNTTSCYPIYWTPPYKDKPFRDWFNTYQVNSITQTSSAGTDPTGQSPTMFTGYTYLGGGAWHFDDNELVKAKYRTYGQWRGFGRVQTVTGQGSDPQTESEATYYRGMSKSTLTGGTFDDSGGGWVPTNTSVPITFTGSVSLTDSQGGQHDDTGQLAGEVLESTSYNWAGSAANITGSTINSYWVSPPTTTRARPGLPDLTANATGQVETWSRERISGSGPPSWRTTETDTSYDATPSSSTFGMPLRVYAHGDLARTDQRRCTTTTYATANQTLNLTGLVAETETDAKACGGANPNGSSVPTAIQVNALTSPASVNPATELVSSQKIIYDDSALGKALPNDLQPGTSSHPLVTPIRGEISETRVANYDKDAGKLTFQVKSAADYDSYGRPVNSYDVLGHKTHVDFTMANGVTTGTKTTNTLGQYTATTVDPLRGLTRTTTDPNGVVSTMKYDGLGRTTAMWGANRPTTQSANAQFTYQVSATVPTSVTTKVLNDSAGYVTSTALFDAMLRPIQTQKVTPRGGRLVTNTIYDTHGWVWKVNNPWWDSGGSPNSTLVGIDDSQVPNQTVTTFDGAGRGILATSYFQSQVKEQVATAYYGDKTITVPPTGGVTAQTFTDALGRTTETDQYTTPPTVTVSAGTGQAPITTVSITGGSTKASNSQPGNDKTQGVAYTFDALGHQTDVTNLASGDVWHTDYNTLGQVTGKKDPDAGSSSMAYDLAGRLLQTTDANGATVSYSYDALGRKIGQFHGGAPTGGGQPDPAQQIASWTYDNRNPDGTEDIADLTAPIGRLTSSTAYGTGGNTTIGGLTGRQRGYTSHIIDGFNEFGKPLGMTVSIPASEGALAGDYAFTKVYTDTLGLLDSETYPASPGSGALPDETVIYGYTGAFDLPAGLGGIDGYVADTSYTAYGQVAQTKIGTTITSAFLTSTYDPHTANLTNSQLTNPAATSIPIDSTTYSYDPAGNPTRQVTTRQGTATETQCFGYDTLDRLTQAWTATDSCQTDPSTNNGATVGSGITGGAYWTSWNLDPLGQRQSETDHGLGGVGDTKTTYTYAGSGNPQPHTLTSTATTTAATPGATPVAAGSQTFTYDKVGSTLQRNTTTRPGQPDQQTDQKSLGWNDTGRLTSVTTGSGGPGYIYDADGALLLQKDPTTHITTLYLPGEQLTLNTTTNTVTGGTRFYPLPGGGQAVRTGDVTGTKVNFQTSDPQGTAGLTTDPNFTHTTWRQQTPYGAPRGTTPVAAPTPTPWPDNHGFLGKPQDTTTGLTNLEARWYDPINGRFASLDPVFAPGSPQEHNGYTYAASNPIAGSDPSGLKVDGCEVNNDCGPGPKPGGKGSHLCDSYCGPMGTHGEALGNPAMEKPFLGHPISERAAAFLRKIGYHGSSDFTIREALRLFQGGLGNEDWDYFCRTVDPDHQSQCADNPFTGDHLTDSDKGLAVAAGVAIVATVAGVGCLAGGCEGGYQAAGMTCLRFLRTCSAAMTAAEGVLEGLGGAGTSGLGKLCHSFAGTTKVLLADGTSKPIEKIKKGDRVANATPGESPEARDQAHTVTAIHTTHSDRYFTDVTIESPYGPQTITGTTNHPYWDATTHTWARADQLHVGDRLQTPAGHTAKILALRNYSNSILTYDLTVDGLHTYYVEAGSTPVLVHNAGPGCEIVDPRGPVGVLLNKKSGDAFRDVVADFLRSQGRVVTADAEDKAALTFVTPYGTRTLDLMVHDKGGKLLGYVETKWGGAGKRYAGSKQEMADNWLRQNLGLTIDVVSGSS